MSKNGSKPTLAVVVLNWNGASDTLACLDSLRQSTVAVSAVVVDNGSVGSDVEQLEASGLADTIIETGANLGYAEGNNVGLRHLLENSSEFRLIGVLNNDTLVNPSAFALLAEQLETCPLSHPVIAPTIVYHDDPSSVWFAGGTIDHGWPRHLRPEELSDNVGPLRQSEWLTGCCLVASADTWRYVGLFDPRYYLIFEDCEWSLRARHLGATLAVSCHAMIEHKVSRSFTAPPSSRLANYYYVRNGLRFDWTFARRHLGRFVAEQVARPSLLAVRGLKWRPGLLFRWLGLLGFVVGQTGEAPHWIEALANGSPRASR